MSVQPQVKLSKSETLLARAKASVPGGVHSNVRLTTKPQPLFFSKASGSRIWDADGNEYIDYVLGQGPIFLGHTHPVVVEAVEKGLRRGQLFAGQHEGEIELAELVCELVPCAEMVRFSSTGTEGIQAALRMARAATGRKRIIKFEGHYDGWIDNIYLNLSPAKLPSGKEIVVETEGQIPPNAEHMSVVPWNDAAAIARELDAKDVAAVVMEPIAANQAVILPEPGYLEAVREACTKTGTVLIFDEVITGFRVAMGGAQELLKVTPDMAVFGKAMASGFPIACIAGRAALMEGVGKGVVTHAGTFNGNVASVTAATATLRTLRDKPELRQAAKAAGKRFLHHLDELKSNALIVQGLPEVFWIGFGSGAVKNVRDLRGRDVSNLLGFDESKAGKLSGELLNRGVHTTSRGTWYVSCMHTEKEIDHTVNQLADSLPKLLG
jgi:glutamate-1-semialdehyde 2,1-aminomutase